MEFWGLWCFACFGYTFVFLRQHVIGGKRQELGGKHPGLYGTRWQDIVIPSTLRCVCSRYSRDFPPFLDLVFLMVFGCEWRIAFFLLIVCSGCVCKVFCCVRKSFKENIVIFVPMPLVGPSDDVSV